MINNLHLNILAIFSDINKKNYLSTEPTNINMVEVLKNVTVDLRYFYKETKSNKKRIDDFKSHKFVEIEIHEIIAKIFCNLSKTPESCNMIGSEEAIIKDIFEFIIKIANFKKDNVNYIKTFLENIKNKRKNPEDMKKIFASIADNSMLGIRNLLLDGANSDYYKNFKLILEKIFVNEENFFLFLSSLESTFNEQGISSSKLSILIIEIKSKLVNFWL